MPDSEPRDSDEANDTTDDDTTDSATEADSTDPTPGAHGDIGGSDAGTSGTDVDVTALLARLSEGESAVLNTLLPAVYDELRRLAHHTLRGEADDLTLRTTELVHEAYLKLVDHHAVDWEDRQHFFAVAARAMRQVLVDHARARTAEKRGGERPDRPLDDVTPETPRPPAAVLAVDQALDRLAELDERQTRVVECRFFGGYTIAETADVLDVSHSTVERDWRTAKAWLQRALKSED
jgi:RNA polymerase sigma factor (TIGR02999 family)